MNRENHDLVEMLLITERKRSTGKLITKTIPSKERSFPYTNIDIINSKAHGTSTERQKLIQKSKRQLF